MKRLLLALLVALFSAPAFAAVCEIDGAGHADGDDDGVLDTGEIIYADELMSCLLANELGVGQVDLTGIVTMVNSTPDDLSDTGVSLREHLKGIDNKLAEFILSVNLEDIADLHTLIALTGTRDGTKFLRDDGQWTAIAGGGDALVANPLSQFAATSCAQFAGVISGETGTCGSVVLSVSPTLTTPVLGVATATSITTGACVLDTNGLTCTAGSAAGQFLKLFEDSDLGTSFFAIDLAATNLSASVTHTPDASGEFDAETLIQDNSVDDGHLDITEEECFPLFTPGSTIADTYDVQSVFRAPVALTITEVWCETDTGTVNFDFQIDDGTPADVMGADLVCASTAVSDSSGLTGSMAAGDRLDFAITSVASSPTRLTACVVYTR